MWHDLTEPFGQSRALCLIGPRGGVSEPGEENSTRDPAKHHQSSPRRGHNDGPAEHGARQLHDGDRGNDQSVHDRLSLNSRVPGVRNCRASETAAGYAKPARRRNKRRQILGRAKCRSRNLATDGPAPQVCRYQPMRANVS